MLSKKDISFLKETFAIKQELQDEMRNMRDYVWQENNRMKKEIVSEIVDVLSTVMDRIKNHERRILVLEKT